MGMKEKDHRVSMVRMAGDDCESDCDELPNKLRFRFRSKVAVEWNKPEGADDSRIEYSQRPMQQQHDAPILHVQDENVRRWRRSLLRPARRVVSQVVGQLEVPLVQFLVEPHRLRVSSRSRTHRIERLHNLAEDDRCTPTGT